MRAEGARKLIRAIDATYTTRTRAHQPFVRALFAWAGFLVVGCWTTVHAGAQNSPTHSFFSPAPTRSTDGLVLLGESLTALRDVNGLHSSESCTISAAVTESDSRTVSIEWTIEPTNYLTTIHGVRGDIHIGGRANRTVDGKTYGPSERMIRSRFIAASAPIWLARAFNNANMFVSGSTVTERAETQLIMLSIADASNLATAHDSAQVWFFDPATFLPLRVDFTIASAMASGVGQPAHAAFSGFMETGAGLYPSVIKEYRGETLTSTTTVSSVVCAAQLHDNSYFAVHGVYAQ
jgi:hypothetical protein